MSMSPGMNRFAALSLALLTALALIFYGVVPLAKTFRDNAQSIATQQRRLATYESLVDNAKEIDAAFAATTSQDAQDNVFLNGENPALASANLRALVNGAVQASGGMLITSQDYQAQPLAGAQAIGLRLQINCEVRNLIDLLFQLEQARPLVVVEALTVGSSAMQLDRNARGPMPGSDPTEAFRGNRRDRERPQPDRPNGRGTSRMSLDVRLDIVGYLPMRNL